jgi:GMP synthase-like glutamine amidotransferase
MQAYFEHKGWPLRATRLFQGEALPALDEFDWLIIMGGPMGVRDAAQYPWLTDEAGLIRQAIEAKRRVLGVCLGAQLMAHALGARVRANAQREIGWFPITRAPELVGTPLGERLPAQLEVFHWHGDTFDIPRGALRVASSEACLNQGFVLEEHALGLQFHLDATPRVVQDFVAHGGNELDGSRFVQSAEQMLADESRHLAPNALLIELLNWLASGR